jgi:hypothetical protein
MVFQSCRYIRISKKNKYMKKLFTLLLVLAGVSAVNAQNNFCGTDENFHRLAAKYPEILQSHNELEAMTKWITQNKGSLSVSRTGAYIVPVVFHILHDGGKEYLSNAMVESQVLYLNQYWNKSNPELPSVTALYQPIVANMGVEFRLAHLDPQGNCTDGIDRIMSFATNVGNNNTKLNPWPPDKYLNIWVNKSVERDSSNFGTIAFSMYPVNVQTWVNNEIIDGVITKIAGVNGGPIGRSTLAHEVGHWLNLKHVWGDTNSPGVSCGDDDVDDTPITKGQSSGCSTSVIECGNTIASNVQNIMNYSSCEYMFTEGQKTRSLIALQSSISNRNNLFSDVNIAATGVEPVSTCLPAPKAEYGTNKRFACVGESLHFTDFTYNTPQWDRTWSFPADAVGASTTDSSQFVSFSTPGWKEVTLVSSNPSGSSTRTKSNVYIADAAGDLPYPHFESFDDPNVTQSWIGINYDNNQTAFSHKATLGHNSNGCFGLNNYDVRYEGDRDELISPSFDLTGIATGDYRLSFDYSMATRLEQDINDSTVSLEILATTNCGTSWKRVGSLTASKLLNGGFTVNPYYPSKGDQYWRRAVVDLTAQGAQFKTAGVRFKFAVTSNKLGNNFFFDNFNLGNSTLGIDASALDMAIDLYPNPTKDNAVLEINSEKPEKIAVVLNDLLGNKIIDLFNGEIDVNKKITIPTSSLSSGMYIVQIQSNGKTIQRKLTKM